MKTLISKTIVLVMLVVTIFTSCTKDDASKQEPVLPPEESMVMDFSNFQSTTTFSAVKSVGSDDTTQYNNWISSAVTIGAWNTAIYLNTVLPITAFKEAFKHPAVFMADSSMWVRTYTVSNLGISYTCKLEGTVNGNSTFWKMYLSKSGGLGVNFSNYVWFTGISSRDGLTATWFLNKGPESKGSPYLNITWVKNMSLRYTLVDTMDANVGNYLEYDIINEAGLDAQFLIQTVKHDNDITIQWHTTNKNGRVKCQNWYTDLNWHYWDRNHKNSLGQ
ncbi:MAG: hypothetical protein GZ091_07275 [Paludibacter sp.]|nr:hypothetical protein [Paludibacter sp.]